MEEFRRFLRIERPDTSDEVDDEIDFHLEMKERELVGAGVEPEEARHRARASFGDSDRIRRDCSAVQRAVRRRRRWGDRFEAWRRDLRLTVRSLKRTPRFTATLALTLGLGIGVTSTVFSMLDALLLAPLPYPDHDRLSLLFELREAEGLGRDRFDLASYEYLRDAQESFDLTAAFTTSGGTLTGERPAERVGLLEASSSFLTLLGAIPAHGRSLTPSDDQPGAPTTAVLSHELWQRRYGGDPAVVGTTITVDDHPVQVVGVLSPSFPAAEVRLWAGAADLFTNFDEERRERGIYTVLARRAEGASEERAREDLRRIAADLSRARAHPFEIDLAPLAEEVTGTARPAVLTVFGAAFILLLITCSNAATLILSRGPERERELALRSALGAGRDRLVRAAALECVVITVLGASLSILMILGAQASLRGLAPEPGSQADRLLVEGWRTIPWLSELDVDLGVLGFTAALAMLTGLLFALIPALRASRSDPSTLLRGRRATGASVTLRGRIGARDVLVVTQVALAFVLLVGGGLLVRSFLAFRATDLGFTPRNVLSLYTNPSGDAYPNRAAAVGFYDDVLTELRRLPGVASVGAVDGLPLTGGVGWTRVAATTVPEDRWAAEAIMSLPRHAAPGYFETMGIRVISGRTFDDSDTNDAPRVVVVDQALADRMWPGEDPLGKSVHARWGVLGEVVGVVQTVRYEPLGVDQPGVYYDVLGQRGDGGHGLYMVVRTAEGGSRELMSAARRVIQEVDPDQPVIDARPMEARLDDALTVRRLSAALLQGFSLLALTLALIGLYGTVRYAVSRSLHSMAIRIALGARTREVAALVLRRTMLLAAAGTSIGAAVALGVSRLLGPLLYGVSPTDPMTFVGLAVLLVAASLAAAVGPVRRAAGVDPMEHFNVA